MSNQHYIDLIDVGVKKLMASGLGYVSKTLAIYEGNAFFLPVSEAPVDVVIAALENIENNGEFIMHITAIAKKYNLEFQDYLMFATAQHAFHLLTKDSMRGIHLKN